MNKPCGLVVKNHDFQSGGPGSIPHGILCLIICFSFIFIFFLDDYSFLMALHYYFLPFEVVFK